MITYIVIHLWCWMWNLGICGGAACFFTFISVVETIAEIAVAACIVKGMYDDGLRVSRQDGKWQVKWDESARKRRSSW